MKVALSQMSFALYSILRYIGTCQEVCSTACIVNEVTGTTAD